MNAKEETIDLLHKLAVSENQKVPAGTDELAIADFEKENGVLLSPQLREWFLFCNGGALGPGALYGIGNASKFVDIESMWALYPEWKARGWLPLASDGCGDYYILDLGCKIQVEHPVFFIDQADLEPPSYIMASDVWQFFRGLFLSELERDPETFDFYWPFDEKKVLEDDPKLRDYNGTVPFAWNAD